MTEHNLLNQNNRFLNQDSEKYIYNYSIVNRLL